MESLSLDFRDVVVAEPGCYLVHCSIPHLNVWALALLAHDTDLICDLAGGRHWVGGHDKIAERSGSGGDSGGVGEVGCQNFVGAESRIGAEGDRRAGGGAGAGSRSVDSVGDGVWDRVGRRWAERGNIGFSMLSAPAKAQAMCQGIALGFSLSLSLSLSRSLCLPVSVFV